MEMGVRLVHQHDGGRACIQKREYQHGLVKPAAGGGYIELRQPSSPALSIAAVDVGRPRVSGLQEFVPKNLIDVPGQLIPVRVVLLGEFLQKIPHDIPRLPLADQHVLIGPVVTGLLNPYP